MWCRMKSGECFFHSFQMLRYLPLCTRVLLLLSETGADRLVKPPQPAAFCGCPILLEGEKIAPGGGGGLFCCQNTPLNLLRAGFSLLPFDSLFFVSMLFTRVPIPQYEKKKKQGGCPFNKPKRWLRHCFGSVFLSMFLFFPAPKNISGYANDRNHRQVM